MADWFADEAFWETFYPILFPKERFENAGEEVAKILSLVKFKGNSVLDLACGPGRHSVSLALKGFNKLVLRRSASLGTLMVMNMAQRQSG
ncbi:methyltransferase [Leptolyngbya sp. Heron Island J]|uniref:methyltransferase n=1 Tax=Leptolyngbya sp. Heron Island J TaxID=1385935 RepID=UPI0003B9628E|nr:methyltransferase [Leptolyngbya sp. Heron Island J]ESA33814.1 methyltransferase [Leptolyngbya sp. Heron Island J]